MLSTDVVFYVCAAAIFVAFYSFRSPVLQTLVLAAGSLAMYATEGLWFLLLLIISSGLTAMCSFVAARRHPKWSCVALIGGIVVNLSVLAIFKYKQMLLPSGMQPSGSWIDNFLAFGLPIGISFYTFHGISLMVDSCAILMCSDIVIASEITSSTRRTT